MKSLFSKLLTSHLVALLIAFGLLGILLRQMLYPYYLHQVIGRQLLERGQSLAQKILPLVEKKDWGALNQTLEVAKAAMGAEICLVNVQGEVLAHAAPPGIATGQPPLASCCPTLRAHGSGLTTRAASLTFCGQDMLVAKVPVSSNPADQGGSSLSFGSTTLEQSPTASTDGTSSAPMLLLRVPFSPINTVAQRFGQLILICALLGMAVALVATLVLSHRISDPLRKMRTMAAGMAKGDFASRLEAGGRDEVGQLAGSFNSLAERLQESLAKIEDESAKLRGVLSSMAEGVLAIGPNESILLANPQTLAVLNLPQKELVGQPLGEAGLPEEVIRAYRASLGERKMVSEEISLSAPQTAASAEGRPDAPSAHLTAEVHIVPMHLGGGQWGAVGVMRDISETHRLEGMRSRFFSDISHELRTPLTNITGYAAALQDGTAADEAGRERALSVILKEGERLRRFIEDLLDLSRLESGEPDLHKEWCDLAPVAASAAESLEDRAREAKVRVRLDLPANLPQAFADPDRISQVFVNLIANAIHFNHPGGEVIVSASAAPQEITALVKDTGVGIPPEELAFVWERFHRGASVVSSQLSVASSSGSQLSTVNSQLPPKGAGLGLAIVRSIVQAHGGRVWAESAPRQGSTFGFALPIG